VILYEQQFAGCCGIHTILSKKLHFGIWIKKEHQGKGIGKKVVHHVLNWGISNLAVEYVKYPVDKRNIRSISLIKSLGIKISDQYQIGEQKVLEVEEYRIYEMIKENKVKSNNPDRPWQTSTFQGNFKKVIVLNRTGNFQYEVKDLIDEDILKASFQGKIVMHYPKHEVGDIIYVINGLERLSEYWRILTGTDFKTGQELDRLKSELDKIL